MPNRRTSIQVHTCDCKAPLLINREQWGNIHLVGYASRKCKCGQRWEFLVSMKFQHDDVQRNGYYRQHVLYTIEATRADKK